MPTDFKKRVLVLGSLCLLFLGLIITLSVLPSTQVWRQRAVGTNEVRLQLNPASRNLVRGESLTVKVELNSTVAKIINTAGVDLQFDQNVFTVSGVACDANFPGEAKVEVSGNKIYLSCFRLGSTNLGLVANTPTSLGQFILQVKEAAPVGSSSLAFIRSYIADYETAADLSNQGEAGSYTIALGTATATLTPGATATPTQPAATATPTQPAAPGATATPTQPAATATPTQPASPGTPVLNFKVKFQGITQKRADQKVKVIVQKGDFTKTFADVNVTANDSGLYAGSVTLDEVMPGAGYTIFVKGPKHLSRRFCADNQAERCSSNRNGTITLAAGQNNLDFSKINLLAGDLPDPADDWKQSGVVNSLDYSLFQARLLKDDEDSLKVADVDLSGQVNAGDWLIMRLTLETAYDEDQ